MKRTDPAVTVIPPGKMPYTTVRVEFPRGIFMRRNKTYNKKKILVIFTVCSGLLLGLAGRLVYLMVFQSDYYAEKADELHQSCLLYTSRCV